MVGLALSAGSAFGARSWSTKEINSMFDTLFNNVTFSASWNHGKILAVGGKTMMTGGINYWSDYISYNRKIIDMQAKVIGDAAVSAHGYADYFWKYLNKAHSTDPRSFKRSIKLNTPYDQVATSWKSDIKVPIFKDTVKVTPNSSGIQVLSIARLGDSHGTFVPDYPVQFADALRDLLINVNAPALVASNNFKGLVRLVQSSADSDSSLSMLKLMGCSPAAWASRIVRVQAIANAKSGVYMSNQMIVCGMQKGHAGYDGMVDVLNASKPKEQAWDGFLWPYGTTAAPWIIT
jgi:phosphatidylserine/phosphatidylglycerophosphate/cardiolipin synthase-like enzyme